MADVVVVTAALPSIYYGLKVLCQEHNICVETRYKIFSSDLSQLPFQLVFTETVYTVLSIYQFWRQVQSMEF